MPSEPTYNFLIGADPQLTANRQLLKAKDEQPALTGQAANRFFCYNHPMPLFLYYLALNIVTFAAFGLDKFYAQTHRWRIPERALLGLALIGGAYGALAGMLLFRHKTRKAHFWWWVLLGCAIHAALWMWLDGMLSPSYMGY